VSDLPLLEFDPSREAVLEPHVTRGRPLPERAVLCLYAEILASLPDSAEQVGRMVAAHGVHPIWRVEHEGTEVAVFHPGVGAPLAAALLEEAIARGVRTVVACGGCGIVSPEVRPGMIVVPTNALPDEGTSFLADRGAPFTAGPVWTTDAIYRETRSKVDRRRDEGCLVVEMETAAFFAVSRFRGIRFTQLLYGGDDLSGDEWEENEWTVSPSRRLTFDLAVELAAQL
jgi:uridine phosphorylase